MRQQKQTQMFVKNVSFLSGFTQRRLLHVIYDTTCYTHVHPLLLLFGENLRPVASVLSNRILQILESSTLYFSTTALKFKKVRKKQML